MVPVSPRRCHGRPASHFPDAPHAGVRCRLAASQTPERVMHIATEDQMLDLSNTLLRLAATKLSEGRFEIFGLAVQLDGELAFVVPRGEAEPTIDGIAATCKRVQADCLAFGIFAM